MTRYNVVKDGEEIGINMDLVDARILAAVRNGIVVALAAGCY
jgi:hypothetical protein